MPDQARGTLLIAAVSGRALARAAVDAGYLPLVADFFADLDTQALAANAHKVSGDMSRGFRWEALEPALEALCTDAPSPPIGLVYGSGFEDRPKLLEKIAERWPLLGNDAATVAEINDPAGFFAAVQRLDLPHPDTRLVQPCDPDGWIAKRAGAAGGSHIGPAGAQRGAGEAYFQKLVQGRPVSALFAANGETASVLGFSEQWTAPAPGKPWRYGGAAQPADLSDGVSDRIADMVRTLSAHFRLVGLNSADFLLDEDEPLLLEVNPRPGATLDIFASAALPLMDIHLNAVQQRRLPDHAPAIASAAASTIVFAPEALTIPDTMTWPDGAADLPKAGEQIDKERPICTLLARAGSGDQARSLVRARARSLLAALNVVEDPA